MMGDNPREQSWEGLGSKMLHLLRKEQEASNGSALTVPPEPPELGTLRQEDLDFGTNLGYVLRS